jgi:glc operon protein GlcG
MDSRSTLRTALTVAFSAIVMAGLSLIPPAATAAGAETPLSAGKQVLTLAGARAVLAAAEAEAARGGAVPAVAIVDDGGNVLLVSRSERTFPAAAAVSIEKARTAALFRKETLAFESAVNGGRAALLGVDLMTPLMGGVPLVVDGQIVGAIGISGAKSQQQDDEIAHAAAAAFGK